MDYVLCKTNLKNVKQFPTYSWEILEIDVFHDNLNFLKDFLKTDTISISDNKNVAVIKSYDEDYKPYIEVRYISKETKEALEDVIGTRFGMCTFHELFKRIK